MLPGRPVVVMLLAGLDVGTTAVKAVVVDVEGRELAHGRAATPWRTVPTGAEIEPDALLSAAVAALHAAVAAAPDGRIAGIGVASIAETGVLVDAHDRPVVPAIAWHDARGEAQAERLVADLGAEFTGRVGLPCSRLCTLAKYRWMREHLDAAARGTRWLNVAEWVVLGLGGEPLAELSLASRTGFYDLHARAPWADALAWSGAPAGLMPEAVPAGTPMGAAVLSAVRGAVLTVGGHDHLAAAVGLGAGREGDVLDSSGTAEAFVRASAPLSPERVAQAVASDITVGWHAIEGRQALLGAVWSGAALERALADLGVAPRDRGAVEAEAAEIERGCGGGDLAGAAYHAALDAQAAAAAEVLADMAAVAGPARRLVVTGGWAAGEGARAVKARHLGAFERSPVVEAGARGAALAAGHAAGLWTLHDAPACSSR